jgi:hypothetical protein
MIGLTKALNANGLTRLVRIYKLYKLCSAVALLLVGAYLLLISFPQVLLANTTVHGRFTVYSSEPIDPSIDNVLDSAEQRLRTSPIYDEQMASRVYLTGSFGMYAFLSNKAYRSFANSVPFINNIIIDRSDVANDVVYVNRPERNSRSLSGVVAHEVTHLFIRHRYGTVVASLMPAWKNEGYCEYIAGDTTMPMNEGLRLWRENPNDDTRYRYIKYQAMVRYLLETEKITVDELFTKWFDEKAVADKTLASLPPDP